MACADRDAVLSYRGSCRSRDSCGRVRCYRNGSRRTLFFFQAEDGIRDYKVTGVQTCALPICSALTALYAAGGVTARADMRQIEVRRLDKVAATLDLYDYLLRGDKHDDIRLETGDVVYVPLHGTRVQVTGAVLRPAVYELKEGGALPDV